MQCPSFLPPFSKTHSMAEAEEAGQPGEGRRTDGGTGGDYWLPFRSSSSNPPCTCHGRMKRGGEGMGLLTVLSSPALRSVVGGELFPWKKRGGGKKRKLEGERRQRAKTGLAISSETRYLTPPLPRLSRRRISNPCWAKTRLTPSLASELPVCHYTK